MICDRCEDQGTIPVPGRDDMVARCPSCHGESFTQKLINDYEQTKTKSILMGFSIGVLGTTFVWFLFGLMQ